ncbi:DedA family protein [Desulfovibrio inopinatus]|uniref:DedA family protein n=1 Tax=Desulfovibrio inopinatus TaxID=102109 RepID=UPI000407E3B2|nr:DedA family protein [Desulfovibrio inopinatus]
MISHLMDIVFHLDTYVATLAQGNVHMLYLLLFVVVFSETGLVVATALPSDTVLFACAALSAQGILSLGILFPLFVVAAFLGDTANYGIGYFVGERWFRTGKVPFVSSDQLRTAEGFYEKHGGLAIVGARFVPVLRALAPLTAAIALMPLSRFLFYNAVGKIPWAALYLAGGYFLGRSELAQQHFGLVVFAAMGAPFCIVLIRVSWSYWKKRGRKTADGMRQ